MESVESKSFSELVSELQASADEVASPAKDSETETEVLNEFALLLEKFTPIFNDLAQNKHMNTSPVRKAIEALELELQRAKTLIQSPNSRTSKQIEDSVHDLGRSLGLVLFTGREVPVEMKEKIGALHKELMDAKFDFGSYPVSDELLNESEEEITEEIEGEMTLDTDDVALQLKYGNDEEFKIALSGLNVLIRDRMVDDAWINDEGIVQILLNRLGSSKPYNRLTIIQILRSLLLPNAENKEKMVDVQSLSTFVKSLTRDVDERREAVALLLALSDLPAVHRRIGRIQGCILMLVAMLNGEDQIASHDAGKLLNALSGNTQNALHMAEAGYFKPMVQYLKEGSDMSKILMATALCRMELTDQSRASLGEVGAIEPLVKMFNAGKLEAKLSALGALQNLSMLKENIQRLVKSGIVAALLQLLFSVTSVLLTLREPASAILSSIAQSEAILVNKDIAQQMLSLLNLSGPGIQFHLLQALNNIAAHSSASKVRVKMKANGAVQLLLPFLTESNSRIRTAALNLLYTLSKNKSGELTDQLGDTHLNVIINIIFTSASECEKAAAFGLLSNLPASDKKATDMLKRTNLLPYMVSIMRSYTSTLATCSLAESVADLLIRFTVPSDRKLQLFSVEHGVIPLLVKFLSSGSMIAKSRAATALAQLSQNSLSLQKSRTSKWLCIPPSMDAFCHVHNGYCFVKSTFCLVKADAVSPLIKILEGKEREADEAVLNALATLLQDEIWESGSILISKMSGVQAIIKVLESGNVKAQEKALWMLERIFRVEPHRVQYGVPAQAVLIDLAQNGEPKLKSTVAKLLAQLELLQVQSSYF
ncbi:hypothetical protein RJ641_036751 [Dillenia turbinata]|uniref:Uncharacterized protein n=1 Tax=Dillenia turbinata TaxID=194707 RepID=A0AAN8ZDJ5_9MAGN